MNQKLHTLVLVLAQGILLLVSGMMHAQAIIPDVDSGLVTTEEPVAMGEWTGDPRWLTDHNWRPSVLEHGLDLAAHFYFGSGISSDEYVPVQLRISPADTTYAQVYRKDHDFAAAGVSLFHGAAFDMSDPDNPRRLNICLIEDSSASHPSNYYWDPDSTEFGNWEIVFIMQSSYDGTGQSYDDTNDGLSSDPLYVWWPRLRPGYSHFQADPSYLNIYLAQYAYSDFRTVSNETSVDLSWNFIPAVADSIHLFVEHDDTGQEILVMLPATQTSYRHDNLESGHAYSYQIKVYDQDDRLRYLSKSVIGYPQIRALNMSLAARWNGRSNYGDVWGYTDPETGAEYGLLCVRGGGVSIIRVTDTSAVEVGFSSSVSSGSDSKDVKVYDHYAVLINEHAPVQVIDLSDPANPVTVATIHTNTGSGGAHNAFVKGDYLYVVGDHDAGGLRIYDLNDPENPVLTGTVDRQYYHDVYVRSSTAYAAAINGGGVDILDVSDKTNPRFVSNFNYPGSGAHNVWTTNDGNYAFVGDETGTSGNWTRIFDLTNPRNAELVSEYITDPNAIVHNFYLRGNYLYVAHYTEGIRVVDVQDPANPREVGYYDTYLPRRYGFNGCWSVYPFFESGNIIGSDMENGLFVLRFDSTAVGIKSPETDIPEEQALLSNYPNPFNPVTILKYDVPKDSHVKLEIYSLKGRHVTTLVNSPREVGTYRHLWEATHLAAGVYIARIQMGSHQESRKLILLK